MVHSPAASSLLFGKSELDSHNPYCCILSAWFLGFTYMRQHVVLRLALADVRLWRRRQTHQGEHGQKEIAKFDVICLVLVCLLSSMTCLR
jgi:hypothetical protein